MRQGFCNCDLCLHNQLFSFSNPCCVNVMLNKNTLGVKKVRGQLEAALQTGATKNLDIS